MSQSTRLCEATGCLQELPQGARIDRRYCSRSCTYQARKEVWKLARKPYSATDATRNQSATYYRNNREKILEYQKSYYRENEEVVKNRSHEWYEANAQRLLAHYRAKTATGVPAARIRERRAADPTPFKLKESRRRARVLSATLMPFSLEDLRQRMAFFGDACWMCGGPYEHIDHVKPLAAGGCHALANLRPSCAQCNLRKGSRWSGPSALEQFKLA